MPRPVEILRIEFGAGTAAIHEQAGLPAEECRNLQDLANATGLLVAAGILTRNEAAGAQRRIVERIAEAVRRRRNADAARASAEARSRTEESRDERTPARPET